MKIEKFVEIMEANKGKIYSKTNANVMSDFIKKTLEVKDYIPVIDKLRLVNNVLSECTEEEFGIIKVDSFKKYFQFTIAILQAHTNLEFSASGLDLYKEYDMLCENGLLDPVIATFEDDYRKTNDILNMMYGDMIENNNNISNVVGSSVQKLSGSLSGLIETAQNKINDFQMNLNASDLEGLQKFLNAM